MRLYALTPQRGAENYAALYAASHYKDKLLGVYYDPRSGLYAPIFRMDKPRRRDAWAFRRVDPEILGRAYKMVCPACGLCCVRNSAAFAFLHEIPPETAAQQPIETVQTRHYGRLKIVLLDTGPAGRCILYDAERQLCSLQAAGIPKPVSCLIHYCTLFAVKGGELYLKVGARRDGTPIYRAASPEEIERISKKLSEKARRLALKLH